MNRTKLPAWLAVAIVLPALVSLFSINKRNQAESLNRATAFAAEYETLESLAASQGMTIDKAIDQLKPQGLNALVLSEETVGELITRGQVSVVAKANDATTEGSPQYSLTFAEGDGTKTRSRVWRGLQIRLQQLVTTPPRSGRMTSDEGSKLVLPSISMSLIRSAAIGLNPEEADLAKRKGLMIIARCGNPTGVSSKAVRETLGWAHEMGASVFLASGDQVLGRKDALKTTVEELQKLGMLYAAPEFAKIGGDDVMVKTAPDNVVRLHSAQTAELDKLSLPDAVERYAKASRERNMRILLIRPASLGADQPLSNYGSFLDMIRDQIVREGGALGTPKPFTEPGIPSFLPILIGILVMPVAWFVFAAFVSDRRARLAAGVALGLLGAACVTHMGLHMTALLASLVFPVAAFLVLDALRPRNVLLGFLATSLVSLVGGLCVAGMLNGLRYYVVADAFTGVKLSIFLPILIIGLYFVMRLSNMREILKSPILWGTAALGLTIAIVLMVMVARTGNDSDVGASSGEMVFRNLLDRILYVRPRTKEFMIGHPLLILGIGMLSYISRHPKHAAKLGGWVALLLMVGSMGQTDIVNTLTHLHIPVTLSLARIGIGAVIGCIIGLGLWAVVSRLLPKGEEVA